MLHKRALKQQIFDGDMPLYNPVNITVHDTVVQNL